MSKLMFIAVFTGFLLIPFSLLAEGIIISGTSGSGNFPLVANNASATLVVDNADAEVVNVAAQAFSGDINLLTGLTPVIKTAPDNNSSPVIIGTLGKSALIDLLAASGKINRTRLEGKWETFCISVVDNPLSGISQALVIAGSDPRGTAFGVFELSRIMGVSPWIWWADVLPEPREAIYVSGDELFGPPSVKYRGMFINDEEWGIQPWAAKKMDTNVRPNGKGDIGPRTYEKIFEMMLRTKSNLMMPAMHACSKAFWFYKENPALARKYRIVMSGSHCEMLLRNNEDEWRNNFTNEYGYSPGAYNWNTNRQTLIRYWGDRIRESENTPALYPIGMRGIHDSGMEGYTNDTDRKNALIDIIAMQRSILRDTLQKPVNEIPQVFCPYKEVLPLYRMGLDLADDVTLLWPDDNHGFIRQLSNPTEQERSGGGGVYYHFSYRGAPQDYLWLTGFSPAKTSFELSKAYNLNCKTVWVFNVGDLKPTEFEYQFAMDLAWDAEKWKPANAHNYVLFWANETFGDAFGGQIAAIKSKYLHLADAGKPEHLHSIYYSNVEMEQRIAEYAALAEQSKAVEVQLPERLKDAYFQLIAYPVECSAAMNTKILGAKLSFEYAKMGETDKAMAMALETQRAYQHIVNLTRKYNKEIAGGKWDGMMNHAPRDFSFFYEVDVADEKFISTNVLAPNAQDSVYSLASNAYTAINAAGKTIETIQGLGAGKNVSLAVLPFDMTVYTASNITSAPYVEYRLPAKIGKNIIQVKCLPGFPLYPGKDLCYALSIDDATPEIISIATPVDVGNWGSNVLRGFAMGETLYKSESDRNINVRIYFAGPGIVLSDIAIVQPTVNDMTHNLVNPDFEYKADGSLLDGVTTVYGRPHGWSCPTPSGNSWGMNKDASNMHASNVFWYTSTPMPANFELAQTVKKAPPGEYIVRCKLGVPKGDLTTQRLFVNQYVQYYGAASDYESNLTAGELNSFANWTVDKGDGVKINLNEMAVRISIADSTDLKIGIRSSNKLKNGSSATDNAGWFKVDYFRLEQITDYSQTTLASILQKLIEEAQALYNTTVEGNRDGTYSTASRSEFMTSIQTASEVNNTPTASPDTQNKAIDTLKAAILKYRQSLIRSTSFIINPSFEYKSEGVLNDGSTFRGDPYGWQRTGSLNSNSWGINNDAQNIDGINVCWYSSAPMPEQFELFQQITDLPAGQYTVKCRLVVPESKLTTQRLFANKNVQYFGYENDYAQNLTAGEYNSFAGWTPTNSFFLKEMTVDVTISKGEDLKLGIRSSNRLKDGTRITSTEGSSNHGWFKVDHFRLELKKLDDASGLNLIEDNKFRVTSGNGGCFISLEQDFINARVRVFNLSGYTVYDNSIHKKETWIPLSKGLHIVYVSVHKSNKAVKVLIK